jgi:glycosyltransferase involved in cell wall biosynthesis
MIPCLNRKRYIRASVKSACLQNGCPKTVVVMDDGSTDGTYEILERMRRRYSFELERSDRPRRGSYWITNRLMERYPAKYYQVLDSDDLLLPGASKHLLDFMKSEKAEIAGGQFELIGANGRPLARRRHWRPYDANAAYRIKRDQHTSRSGMVWKRSVIEKIGTFNDETVCTSDYEFALKALETGIRVRNTRETIVKKRVHADTLSHRGLFGGSNPERERNLKRIRNHYPPYHRFRFEYLDFFENEMAYFSPPGNVILENWLAEFLENLLWRRRIDDLGALIRLARKMSPAHPEKRGLLACLELARGARLSDRVRDIEAKGPLYLYRAASMLEQRGRFSQAVELFRRVSRKRGVDRAMRAGVSCHLGRCAMKQNDCVEARRHLLRCLQNDPGHRMGKKLLNRIESRALRHEK